MANRGHDSIIRRVMVETGLLERWEIFEKNELHAFLERQVAISSSDPKGLVCFYLLRITHSSFSGGKPPISC